MKAETLYPNSVNEIIEYVKKKKLWYSITWNHEAMSCADAANKRFRLGKEGIPLCDELKSNIGYYFSQGIKKYLLLHCRGNQMIDDNKVNSLIQGEFVRLPNDELLNTFNCEYGLVNPIFFGKNFPDIEQIFDESIFKLFFPPYTLMTNANDKNWGIELKPKELIKILKKTIISNIITDDSRINIRKHKIGILTGNSPESGIFLWQKINETIRAKLNNDFLGDLSFPTVLVVSLPEMGLSMELDNRQTETWNIVEEGITSLCNNGATIIGIACNTTQFFSEEINKICSEKGAEFISMATAVNSFLIKENITHFDFLGIKFVTDFNKWSDYRLLNGLYKVEVPSYEDLKKINQLAFVVKKGVVTPEGINKLRNLINQSTKTKNIIIALTELSILLATQKHNQKSNKRFIDTLSLLGQNIADRYLEDYSEMLILNQKAIESKQ